MHNALTGGFQGKTGNEANVAQGDDFLSIIVPIIMASKAYQDNGAIIIWWDETHPDRPNDNPDDFPIRLARLSFLPLLARTAAWRHHCSVEDSLVSLVAQEQTTSKHNVPVVSYWRLRNSIGGGVS